MNLQTPTIPKIPAIALAAVKSSQIHAIGHDAATNTLRVQFKNRDGSPGSRYDYPGVPAETHADMLKAESIGKFFGKYIKTRAFTKLPAV